MLQPAATRSVKSEDRSETEEKWTLRRGCSRCRWHTEVAFPEAWKGPEGIAEGSKRRPAAPNARKPTCFVLRCQGVAGHEDETDAAQKQPLVMCPQPALAIAVEASNPRRRVVSMRICRGSRRRIRRRKLHPCAAHWKHVSGDNGDR